MLDDAASRYAPLSKKLNRLVTPSPIQTPDALLLRFDYRQSMYAAKPVTRDVFDSECVEYMLAYSRAESMRVPVWSLYQRPVSATWSYVRSYKEPDAERLERDKEAALKQRPAHSLLIVAEWLTAAGTRYDRCDDDAWRPAKPRDGTRGLLYTPEQGRWMPVTL